jgi:putative tryptophan/tyrosine transport system substrate-binding protein
MSGMRRRELIALLGGAAASGVGLRLSYAQRALPLIGFLGGVSPIGWENYLAGFHRGLNEAGFVEGQNVKIEYRWAQGNYDHLPALAAELVARNPTVIIAAGGIAPAQAAKAATSSIPIIFTAVPDAVRDGLVASLARPGGNLTGLSVLTPALLAKRFELLIALAPKATVFGMLVNARNPGADREVSTAREAAAARGMKLHGLAATADSEIEAAFADLVARDGRALIVSTDAGFTIRRDHLIALAARHAIPTIYGWPEYPNAGGLASYGPDLSDQYRLCGVYAGRILKGAKPADLPVIQPAKFQFVINLKTAKTLGLELPPTALAIADDVIE